MKLSISKKIIGTMAISVLAISGIFILTVTYFLSTGFNEVADREINHLAEFVQSQLDKFKDKVLSGANLAASRPDIITAIDKGDTKYLQKIGQEIVKKTELQVVTIANKDGTVIARGHSDKTGDSVLNQVNVKKALSGEASVGLEEGTVVKLSYRAGMPVKLDEKIIGSITTGIDLSSSNNFVDEIKKAIGVECTIFHHDNRVSTSIIRDGKRAIGTKMDNPKVLETVLNRGQRFINVNQILGKDYNTAYWPLIGVGNKTCGMVFIGKERDIIEKTQASIIRSILTAILVVGTLMIGLGLFMSRSITRPITRIITNLRDGADQVSSASAEVSGASQQLAEGSSEQAASLEETSSSLEEMSSMTQQNADNASHANALINDTGKIVEQADQYMTEVTTSMDDISVASSETSKIIKTIDEIAFQTNLLALNAAVEAARAGEAGAGFAVVADEVRNLAMRAADAAKNTANLIETTVDKVKNGAELVHKTAQGFSQVTQSIAKIKDLVGEITAASNEQAQGVNQINKAVTEMDKVVQQNAANAEESASASEELSAQAEQMKAMVGALVVLVEGSTKNDGHQKKPTVSRQLLK